ncbi:TetR/AcrR family transcriptional regulator [Parafrankia sp. EUN1f]|uniref:TetR/AcrR family transcriptional regulator n=1 Tax=Parafrankia sp. EUN1f TaxID=102897 RepID=UPI0001C44394|nr:TetR/AcrR family transcriptional regulator [Parafrankia sp. EUN1f]EFC82493.1 transcriptional regulator, TetR family [Parafrankia sp. EUN1f]
MTKTTRRRGEALEQAILEAVTAELAEHGYAGLTFEGVAVRAETSKPVLYRRWPTKAEMVAAATVRANSTTIVSPDTGSLAGDLLALLDQVRTVVDASDRSVLLTLMAELPPSAAESLRELLVARGTQLVQPIVDHARQRGELGDAPLPSRLLALPIDLVRHEILVTGTPSDAALRSIVDVILMPLLRAAAGHGQRPG